MYFTLNGKEYKVKFYRNGTNTYAELWELDDVKDWGCTNLIGVARLSKKDRFVKKVGRVVALTNLIKRMQEVSAGDSQPEFSLTKEEKKLIWDSYFLRHKI